MTTKQLTEIKKQVIQFTHKFSKTGHDLNHFFAVRDNALKIATLLRVRNKLDLNLLQAICLLHDLIYSQPSILPLATLYRYIWEGNFTAHIVRKLIKKVGVNKTDKKIILKAIRRHPHSFPWRKLNKKGGLYTKILQDADTLDLLQEARSDKIEQQDWLTRLIAPLLDRANKIGQKHKDLFLNYPDLAVYFSDKQTFVYQKWGNPQAQQTILCLHGYGSDYSIFAPLAERLKNRYQIISLQLPYWRFNQIFSVKEITRYLENFRQELKLEKIILVGFSLGGIFATDYSFSYPDHTSKLILLNSLPQLLPSKKLKAIFYWCKPAFTTPFFLFFYSYLATSKLLRKMLQLPKISQLTRRQMRQHFFSVFGTLFNNLDFAKIDEFNRLSMPKIVMLFKDDEVFKWHRVKKIIPFLRAKIRVVQAGGHNTKSSYWNEVAKVF